MINYEKLSKEVSYALRHAPEEYELELDEEGFVKTSMLLDSINEGNNYERKITEDDLKYIIEHSDKVRHEIAGDKIRALYGHSVGGKILKSKGTPPDVLYHGTTHAALPEILKKGLLPMNRQYVHLSVTTEMALSVGKRRDPSPVLLAVDAKKAYAEGVVFYIGNDKVWLCDKLPAEYIKVM